MVAAGYALFPTAIGACCIVWSERGVLALHLPAAGEADTRAGLARRFPEAADHDPPEAIREAIAGITALLQGRRVDLSAVPLDMETVPPFHRRVYDAARRIPPGRTQTYGQIAAELGGSDARAVGQALGQNPFALIVPCHRVLAAGGQSGGFSAPGGVQTKLRLLAIEGARPPGEPGLFD
jgi:methylated-DNA-[protein]-cysteine S-methyltransferase